MAVVYLAYTKCETLGWVPELLRIYSKSHYQAGFNWLSDLASRCGWNDKTDGNVKVTAGSGKIAAQVVNPVNGQVWWLERWETE